MTEDERIELLRAWRLNTLGRPLAHVPPAVRPPLGLVLLRIAGWLFGVLAVLVLAGFALVMILLLLTTPDVAGAEPRSAPPGVSPTPYPGSWRP